MSWAGSGDRWKGGHQSEEESNRMEANMKMVKRFNDLIKTETERTKQVRP